MNQLVNDLITVNNNNDFRLNSSQSLNCLQMNSFISDNCLTNAFKCGEFGLNGSNKQEGNGVPVNTANGYNPLSVSQSAYSQNTLPFIQTQDLMDSQRYSNIESFPDRIRASNTLTQSFNGLMSDQLNPMSNQLINSLNNSMPRVPNPTTNPLPNQINTCLVSSQRHKNSSQSVVQSLISKSVPLPYNQSQRMDRNKPLLELSGSEGSQMGSRQLRSIRARNGNPSSVEPTNRVNYYLDKSYEELKHLEKERKKVSIHLKRKVFNYL